MNVITRGDIFYAYLGIGKGSEQGSRENGIPVLVIQNDVGNRYSRTLIVAPITASDKPILPTHVLLRNIDFLKINSIVLLEQIKTIDSIRLSNYIGHLNKEIMAKIDIALSISVGLNKGYCA